MLPAGMRADGYGVSENEATDRVIPRLLNKSLPLLLRSETRGNETRNCGATLT